MTILENIKYVFPLVPIYCITPALQWHAQCWPVKKAMQCELIATALLNG